MATRIVAVAAASAIFIALGTSMGQAAEDATSHAHHGAAPATVSATPSDSSALYKESPRPSSTGRFIVHCQPTVRDRIDPIVTPGIFGRSHEHDFYGPTEVSKTPLRQTLAEIAPATSCSEESDGSTYWHPTLYRAGIAVRPQRVQAYYKVNDLTKPAPRGLAYVAGSPGTPRTDGTRVRWVCGGDGDDHSHSIAVSCEEDEYLTAAVSFPGCWNGREVIREDYTSHMAYADAEGRCPSTHPLHIPQLDLFIQWDCAQTCGRTEQLTLSSGSTGGLHADVVFDWSAARQKQLIRSCQARDCGILGEEKNAPSGMKAASGVLGLQVQHQSALARGFVSPQRLMWLAFVDPPRCGGKRLPYLGPM